MDGLVEIVGTLIGELQADNTLSGTLSAPDSLSGELTIPPIISPDIYTGDVEFTPTQQTQQIIVGGKLVPQDIIINPIPNNYGLITWNGSSLTVS